MSHQIQTRVFFFPAPLQQLSSKWRELEDDQRCVGNQNPPKSDFFKKKSHHHNIWLAQTYLCFFFQKPPGWKPTTPCCFFWGGEAKIRKNQATPVLSMIDTQSPEPWGISRDSEMRLVKHVLGGGFKYFCFSPLYGEMIQFD